MPTRKRKEVPEEIRELEGNMSLPEFLKKAGISVLRLPWTSNAKKVYYRADGTTWSPMNGDQEGVVKVLDIRNARYRYHFIHKDNFSILCHNTSLLYVDQSLQTWAADITLDLFVPEDGKVCGKNTISVGGWKPNHKLLKYFATIQPWREVLDRIQEVNPYAKRFIEEEAVNPYVYCMAPQLEQIHKMGIRFAGGFIQQDYYGKLRFSKSEADVFNRLAKPGRNPGEIFQCSKAVYTALKENPDIMVWDVVRRLEKTGKIQPQGLGKLVASGYSVKELGNIASILAKKYHGKPVFTLETLARYLERIDMFEAIGREEGLELLGDYLKCCDYLDVKPKVDGDSLKREHDVMARNARHHRDEILAKKMEPMCEKMREYDYSESVFFIRGIRSFDDLLDEACQQHNCLAGYAQSIASGRTMVFVLREKAHPEKSLVSVKLSPQLRVLQKYMAWNQPIRNKSITEFLKRWEKKLSGIREKGPRTAA